MVKVIKLRFFSLFRRYVLKFFSSEIAGWVKYQNIDEKKLFTSIPGYYHCLLDVGAFNGKFFTQFLKNYASECYFFEPIKENFLELTKEITQSNHYHLFNYALVNESTAKLNKIRLSNELNSSSMIISSSDKSFETVRVMGFNDFFNKNLSNKENIFVKMNIEGAEYDLLEDIDNINLSKIDVLLIQFHDFEKTHKKRRKFLVRRLLNSGFKIYFSYPFIWECYIRDKDVASK